jgi:hypothetical protein
VGERKRSKETVHHAQKRGRLQKRKAVKIDGNNKKQAFYISPL